MFAFVLAVALVAPATNTPQPPKPPASIEEACDPARLQALVSKQDKNTSPILTDLDQRIAATLFEERKQTTAFESAHPNGAAASSEGMQIPLAALMVLALLGAVVAGVRKKGGTAAVCALVVAAAGGYGWCSASRVAEQVEAREKARMHIADLAACRGRLVEARAIIDHGRLARCLYDITEFDEDMRGWLGPMRDGQDVGILPKLEKMDKEMTEAVH